MKLEFEPLTRENAKRFYALEKECFSDPWSEAAFFEEADNPLGVYFLAKADGEDAGYAGFLDIFGEGQITSICTAQKHRRRGIAQALMDLITAQARGRGIGVITLEVRESNAAARTFYKKNGFYEVGRRRGYYQNPSEDAVLMDMELQ